MKNVERRDINRVRVGPNDARHYETFNFGKHYDVTLHNHLIFF